jgi:Putative ATP-binding cassette
MDARLLLLSLTTDLRQGRRRLLGLGPTRIVGTVVAVVLLAVAEVWIVARVTHHLLALPPALAMAGRWLLARGLVVVAQLALVVATASAVTLALPQLEVLESDPWWGACPTPPSNRALQAWWRVLAGEAWVAVLVLPPALTLAHSLRHDTAAALQIVCGILALLGLASAAGIVLALLLAALVPRRILVPLAWTTTTAAVVGTVLWLRALRPERFVTTADPLALLGSLAVPAAAGAGPYPAQWAVGAATGARGWPMAVATAAMIMVMIGAWRWLAPVAGARLATGSAAHAAPSRLWRPIDRILERSPVGVLVASRLRLLARDAAQAAQTLYLIALGVVYVENLRALPTSEPLARELAGLINLLLAGLLAAAMALRFAYPAQILEGRAVWWWRTAPVSRRQALLAAVLVATLAPLALAGGLFAASQLVVGPTRSAASGWWLVPWYALWMSSLGVAMGPRPDQGDGAEWLDAALGAGGMGFLAIAAGGVLWTVVCTGRTVIADVIRDLGGSWRPGVLAGRPEVVAGLLSALAAVAIWRRSLSTQR